ncbi:MAG TPA: glycosyltransferase family 4 protein [Pirellulales bacterium]|nr:glycosyltransferase family 4 protein [Pirellulales bacterium]
MRCDPLPSDQSCSRRVVYVTTAPMALRNLCAGQLAFLRSQGYEIYAISNPGEDLDVVAQREGVHVIGIPMHREIRPLADLASLWRLWRLLRRLRPDIITTATAKASLLGLTAAWLARVPARVYQLWGLRLETTRGLKRRILWLMEVITAACAQRVICVSESLRREFVAARCAPADKTVVLLNGSSNGVDASRFRQTPEVQSAVRKLRAEWGMAPSDPVIGFVGRFVRDKGIAELIDAFDEILTTRPDAWLLLVGDYETGDPVSDSYVRRIGGHPRIIRPGFVRDLAPYYGAMSVLAFPTYREGFPNVVLEAAAAELPTVTFRATGAVDAVQDSATGLVVEIGDARGLAAALLKYLLDDNLRRRHGQAARERVLRDFSREPIWQALDAQFREVLAASKNSARA